MSPQHVGFVDAVKLFFTNYVNFEGRSTRSEYWWWVLADIIISVVLSALYGITNANLFMGLASIFSLACLLPGLSLMFRRLHDIGKSGLWILIALVPLVGAIVLLIFAATPSGPANKWGEPASR